MSGSADIIGDKSFSFEQDLSAFDSLFESSLSTLHSSLVY